MPKVLLEVPDTQESVLRPVVFDIARQVIANTHLVDDIQILFPGDLERAQQAGASISTPDGIRTQFAFNSRLSVSVQEEYNADRLLINTVFTPENHAVFQDRRIDTAIRPVYGNTHTTLSFKYRAKDKTEAIRWRDDIRNRTTMNRDVFTHNVTYHYLVPPVFMAILQELHRLRANVASYGDTWEEWWGCNRTPRATLLTNQAGEQGRWGVRETQMRVQGWFDFEGVPEPGSKDDEADTWTISFDYHFHYDKPLACELSYPLMVHQQLLDQRWRPDPTEMPAAQEEYHARAYSSTARCLSYFEAGKQMYPLTRRPGYAIPEFDEFVPRSVMPKTLRMFTVMIELDPKDPCDLLNLKHLGDDIEIDCDLLHCLSLEAPYMTRPYQSVFSLTLYQGREMQAPECLTIDADLNVRSTRPLDLRQTYHVRLAIQREWDTLARGSVERLKHCPNCLIKLLDALDPTLKHRGYFECVIDDVVFPRDCLQRAVEELSRSRIRLGNGQVYQFDLVSRVSIKTGRIEDLSLTKQGRHHAGRRTETQQPHRPPHSRPHPDCKPGV